MNRSDAKTAEAFAESWNRVGEGSVYTRGQFLDWMAPIDPEEFRGKEVIELGFGNGSLLYHFAAYVPSKLAGLELGDTIETTRRNLGDPPFLDLHRGDLTTANLGEFDLAYCIGVIHHLQQPELGFRAVLRHTKPGGRFHCWVYAREGNFFVIAVVDPIRRVASKLPWWLTKYAIALPLAIPFYAWAKLIRLLSRSATLARLLDRLPMTAYMRWIAPRELAFFRHVAFDQLVTPSTRYIKRETVDGWLRDSDVEPGSSYVIFRNGNSWKFGGKRAKRDGGSGA